MAARRQPSRESRFPLSISLYTRASSSRTSRRFDRSTRRGLMIEDRVKTLPHARGSLQNASLQGDQRCGQFGAVRSAIGLCHSSAGTFAVEERNPPRGVLVAARSLDDPLAIDTGNSCQRRGVRASRRTSSPRLLSRPSRGLSPSPRLDRLSPSRAGVPGRRLRALRSGTCRPLPTSPDARPRAPSPADGLPDS